MGEVDTKLQLPARLRVCFGIGAKRLEKASTKSAVISATESQRFREGRGSVDAFRHTDSNKMS